MHCLTKIRVHNNIEYSMLQHKKKLIVAAWKIIIVWGYWEMSVSFQGGYSIHKKLASIFKMTD